MNVKSADRTVDLFEAFAAAQTPLSLSALARAMSAPASSCFNLVRTLQNRGYLYVAGPKQLYPTRRLFDIAKTIVANDPWMSSLEPALERLRDQTKETVILGTRQGDRVVYLNVIEGPQTIRYSARVGDLKPLHSSSIGKSFLGVLAPNELQDLLKKLRLNRVTETTITDRSRLLAEIERGRKLGYFVTAGENVADVMAVAAPVRLAADVYGIAIAGPMHRMSNDLARHISKLKASCAEMAQISHARAALQPIA